MNSIFHSAALRLTLMYLTIIMGISIGFSVAVYQLSYNELRQGWRRDSLPLQLLRIDDSPNFERLRREQLTLSERRLKARLIAFNLLTLAGGGFASYYFARRSLRPIEEALENQKRFSADASHELRTPLTIMQTEIEVALRDTTLDLRDAKKLLRSNLAEIKNLDALSENLLRLARNDAHDVTLSRLNLKRVIDKAWSVVAPKATHKRISLISSVSAKSRVVAHEASLVELLTILFDNAIKYSPSQSDVRVGHTKTNNLIAHIDVTDQGQGIEAKDLPYIFDRFYRGDSARSKDESGQTSYGLGLAIARQLAEKMDGTLEAFSTKGKGTTMRLTLSSRRTAHRPAKTNVQ